MTLEALGPCFFHRQFIKGFSSTFAPIIECLKGDSLKWTSEAHKSFDLIKPKVIEVPILSLLDFDSFLVGCDASNMGISVVLSQEGKPTTFFSHKIKVKNYLTYDKEFYATCRYLNH